MWRCIDVDQPASDNCNTCVLLSQVSARGGPDRCFDAAKYLWDFERQRKTAIQSGGGRESNPPTGASRRTGFEDREGHQSPFASAADRRRLSGRNRAHSGPKRPLDVIPR
jgi:hypothetical protein